MKNKFIIAVLSVILIASLFVLYAVVEHNKAVLKIAEEKQNIVNEIVAPVEPVENEPTVKTDIKEDIIEVHNEVELASRASDSREIKAVSDDGYLGKFRVTRYCPCEICCGKWAKNREKDENGIPIAYGASGKRLNSGYSCAADTSLPFGTVLYIPQIDMTVTVEDRAAKSTEARYDGKFVDLYFNDHAHYIEGATDYMEVYIVECMT